MAKNGLGATVKPSDGTVEGFSAPGGNSRVKFCSIAVKKSNVFIRASTSPGQTRFPVGSEIDVKSFPEAYK